RSYSNSLPFALFQPQGEMRSDTLCGASVPEFGHPSSLAPAAHDLIHTGEDTLPMTPDKRIRPLLDGDGTFGVFAHGEARYRQRCSFFLDAARVGQHEAGVAQQPQRLEIALRRQ